MAVRSELKYAESSDTEYSRYVSTQHSSNSAVSIKPWSTTAYGAVRWDPTVSSVVRVEPVEQTVLVVFSSDLDESSFGSSWLLGNVVGVSRYYYAIVQRSSCPAYEPGTVFLAGVRSDTPLRSNTLSSLTESIG